jgi:hypothetical protein
VTQKVGQPQSQPQQRGENVYDNKNYGNLKKKTDDIGDPLVQMKEPIIDYPSEVQLLRQLEKNDEGMTESIAKLGEQCFRESRADEEKVIPWRERLDYASYLFLLLGVVVNLCGALAGGDMEIDAG